MSINSYQTAQDLLEHHGNKSGEELLSAMIKEVFPDRICLVSSFGAEAAILLHMVSRIDPSLPVIFIDTQKLFPETLEYRDTLIKHFSLKDVRTYYPDYVDTSRSDPNSNLWKSNTNACCYIRKVQPLARALKSFDAWITGRKRYQAGTRTDMPLIEALDGRIKINPLATWTRRNIQETFKKHKIPEHPLLEHGYLSIGCMPCTSVPKDLNNPRSGRWSEEGKTECGIHLGEDGHFQPNNHK